MSNTFNLPLVGFLPGGARVRVTRIDAADIVFDRLGAQPQGQDPEIVLESGLGVPARGVEFATFAEVLAFIAAPAVDRAELRARVTARRRELERVFVYQGVPFDSDAASRSNFAGVLVTLRVLADAGEAPPETITWKCADDVHRAFTPGDFTLISLALSQYVQGLFAREGELVALVNAAPDAAALAALVPHVEAFTLPPPPAPPPEPADAGADSPNL